LDVVTDEKEGGRLSGRVIAVSAWSIAAVSVGLMAQTERPV
jgi:hypothetical protein